MLNLKKYIDIWNNHGFEIVLGICVILILVFSIYRKITGKKGHWSRKHFIPDFIKLKNYKKHSRNNLVIRSHSFRPKDSKGEIECRRVLQYLFSKSFSKARPDFLNNPVTGGSYNLELDCFDSELRLAVEYNGRQHYEYTPYFHKNKEAFYNQKYRDDMKQRICRDNNINLITVPYTVKLRDIKDYIVKECRRLGYQV